MKGQAKIKLALEAIMDKGEANACHIQKSFMYDGAIERYGWFFTRFNSTPSFLGTTISESLETIQQIKEEKALN